MMHATAVGVTAAAVAPEESEGRCGVCREMYQDARTLKCGHVYCTGCLQALHKSRHGYPVLLCPACRRPTPVPAGKFEQSTLLN